jgi:hypothetical protein
MTQGTDGPHGDARTDAQKRGGSDRGLFVNVGPRIFHDRTDGTTPLRVPVGHQYVRSAMDARTPERPSVGTTYMNWRHACGRARSHAASSSSSHPAALIAAGRGHRVGPRGRRMRLVESVVATARIDEEESA